MTSMQLLALMVVQIVWNIANGFVVSLLPINEP